MIQAVLKSNVIAQAIQKPEQRPQYINFVKKSLSGFLPISSSLNPSCLFIKIIGSATTNRTLIQAIPIMLMISFHIVVLVYYLDPLPSNSKMCVGFPASLPQTLLSFLVYMLSHIIPFLVMSVSSNNDI